MGREECWGWVRESTEVGEMTRVLRMGSSGRKGRGAGNTDYVSKSGSDSHSCATVQSPGLALGLQTVAHQYYGR